MKQAFRVALGFLILWASVLHAEVRIEITQGVDSARPIGVVPFKWAGPGTPPEDIGKIVGADLRNSGKFNPIDVARMPQQPTTASEVTPAAWTALRSRSRTGSTWCGRRLPDLLSTGGHFRFSRHRIGAEPV